MDHDLATRPEAAPHTPPPRGERTCRGGPCPAGRDTERVRSPEDPSWNGGATAVDPGTPP